MENYKLLVSKDWKKYTIIFKSDSEKLARDRVHNEWYSILSIEKTNINNKLWNIFIFVAYSKNWELKKWKIEWIDIFKVYVKLRKNFEYNVKVLYSEKDFNLSNEDKKKIVLDLNEEYNIVFSDNEEKVKNNVKIKKVKNNKLNNNFYLKKELDNTYKLINFVLIKIEKIINKEIWISITLDEQLKLKTIFNSIVRLKKSSNINKLKEIWELALLKIWQIELRDLELNHSSSSKKLLKETNILLSKIWSEKKFIEKSKDINLILSNFISNIKVFFQKLSERKEEKEEVDKLSHSYVKNILILNKYKEKLKENSIFILKNLFKIIVNSELRTEIFIKRRVLKQNIVLFIAKEKGVWFSYTSIKKWFSKILNKINKFIVNFNLFLLWIIIIYIVLFLISINILEYNIIQYNYKWILYFIVTLLIYIILKLYKNIFLFLLNFVILYFIYIFWVVNF